MVKDKELKADALKKYGGAWLKTFEGVGEDSKNHLLNIHINGSNVISGGHDKATFEAYLNAKINVPTGQKRGTWTVQKAGTISEVTYTLYYADGTVRGTGFKTLINDLTTTIDTWADRANKALWKAIKDKTFAKGTPAFSVSADGYTFGGFYNLPKTVVDTFYPT
jgi:hypothetical protein